MTGRNYPTTDEPVGDDQTGMSSRISRISRNDEIIGGSRLVPVGGITLELALDDIDDAGDSSNLAAISGVLLSLIFMH